MEHILQKDAMMQYMTIDKKAAIQATMQVAIIILFILVIGSIAWISVNIGMWRIFPLIFVCVLFGEIWKLLYDINK